MMRRIFNVPVHITVEGDADPEAIMQILQIVVERVVKANISDAFLRPRFADDEPDFADPVSVEVLEPIIISEEEEPD